MYIDLFVCVIKVYLFWWRKEIINLFEMIVKIVCIDIIIDKIDKLIDLMNVWLFNWFVKCFLWGYLCRENICICM